jgi:hypothetical protein
MKKCVRLVINKNSPLVFVMMAMCEGETALLYWAYVLRLISYFSRHRLDRIWISKLCSHCRHDAIALIGMFIITFNGRFWNL